MNVCYGLKQSPSCEHDERKNSLSAADKQKRMCGCAMKAKPRLRHLKHPTVSRLTPARLSLLSWSQWLYLWHVKPPLQHNHQTRVRATLDEKRGSCDVIMTAGSWLHNSARERKEAKDLKSTQTPATHWTYSRAGLAQARTNRTA